MPDFDALSQVPVSVWLWQVWPGSVAGDDRSELSAELEAAKKHATEETYRAALSVHEG